MTALEKVQRMAELAAINGGRPGQIRCKRWLVRHLKRLPGAVTDRETRRVTLQGVVIVPLEPRRD